MLNPRTATVVWMLVALVCALLKTSLGEGAYNNFMVFRGVAHHLFSELPLYELYPSEYTDMNHYGPFFAFVIAPFAYLPTWIAVPLWVVGSSALLLWALRSLPLNARAVVLILYISINDLFTAGAMQQFNIAVAAILVGSFTLIERRKEGWAALLIVIATFVKIYGIVGLAFFFFVKRKGRFIFYMALWSVVALLLPLLFVEPSYLWEQYAAWFADIADKNLNNIRVDQLYQNVSLLGVFRKVSGSSDYSDLPIMASGVLLFVFSYLRWRQFAARGFRLVMLASVMIFVVIFSSGSENSGYIIAAIGVGIWWVTLRRRTPFACVLLMAVCVATFANNLFPREIYRELIFKYALRAIPYALVWLHTIYQLVFRDFLSDQPPVQKTDLSRVDIDVVLPVYNPASDWDRVVVEKLEELKTKLSRHRLVLYLSNDGSTNGNFQTQAQRIATHFGDVHIIDNALNQGKGAALRSGVVQTTSPLVVYTDYDFPYRLESVVELVGKLENGADVVLAARNNTYHKKLSPIRLMLSKMSKRVNWLVLGMNYPDAQGGLKGFNSRGREIFLTTKVKRFLFDTEFIYKCSKRTDIEMTQISANLRDGVHLPGMSGKTIRTELKNLVKIIFTA